MKTFSGTLGIFFIPLFLFSCSKMDRNADTRPNILWITFEDIGPYLGCYGDSNAVTPNLDGLAMQGVRYTNAFANAPVCAPARSTIITGMYPPGLGTEHMRSTNEVPGFVRLFPGYLRDAGYYCTNNSKKDYNLLEKQEEWDESSGKAHYKNRRPGQPFFAVFNITVCHESCLHQTVENLSHDPARTNLPPYHPDLPEIRHDWARFYDRITLADSIAGSILAELEASGLSDSTIVIIYGDHGGVLGRSKRFMYATGLRVPMIVRVPEMFKQLSPGKAGSLADLPVSFVDLAPTLLNLAGITVPGHMQGTPFLGRDLPERSPYVYTFRGRMDERYDFSRGTFSKDFHYIVNYMPHRIYAQHLDYLWRAPSMRAWEGAFLRGECNEDQSRFFGTKPPEELYDRKKDPWEVNNLAGDPEYREVLMGLRKATVDWQLSVRDAGFIPEGMMKRPGEGKTIYDFSSSDEYPVEEIMEIAFLAIQGDSDNIRVLGENMNSDHPVIRYWALTGAVILGKKAGPLLPVISESLKDEIPEVRIVAAEALYTLDRAGPALASLRETLHHETPETVLFTLNVLQSLGKEALGKLHEDLLKVERENENEYIRRAVEYALKTAGI